jgi:DNA-binding transcriptional LysR family regulator
MAQPPLSRQIAALEDQLGGKLFDRSRNQIRLTDAGTAFLQRARDTLRDLDSASREARLIGQGGAGQLRIAFVGSATHGPLPGLIQAYRSKYKNVDLSLSSMNNADLERALIRRDIDIAVARPYLSGSEELRSAELFREPLILAIPDGSPFADAARSVDLRDLSEEPFVLYPRRPRPSFADFILRVCSENEVTPEGLNLCSGLPDGNIAGLGWGRGRDGTRERVAFAALRRGLQALYRSQSGYQSDGPRAARQSQAAGDELLFPASVFCAERDRLSGQKRRYRARKHGASPCLRTVNDQYL